MRRRSRDGQILARKQVIEGYRRRILGTTLLQSDDIILRSADRLHVYRWSDGSLAETARLGTPSTGWFVRGTELLLAVQRGDDCVVRRIRLPDLAPLGEVRLPNVVEPILGYFPDGRRFGALASGRMHIRPLPSVGEQSHSQ